MRAAVLLAAPWVPGSVDMTEYIRLLEEQGHEAVFICLDRAEGKGDFQIEPADRATLETAAFYRNLRLDAAIVFTWLRYPKIIQAMKDANMRVLLRGDSDGMFSIRRFPRHHLRVRMSAARGMLDRGRAAKHLAERFMIHHRGEDREHLDCLAAADVAVLETEAAMNNVAHFLRHHRKGDLISKLHVSPHFVADEFLTHEVFRLRRQQVTCIGRWEDAQKNAPLLARTIEIHLARHPETTFQIIGPEAGRGEFATLMARYPQVNFLGPQKADGIRKILAMSKVLLSSSRWEGAPVVANEALAGGATIVGTPIPAFLDLCGRGYGTAAKKHSAGALADALDNELSIWNRGQRDPVAIAGFWRPKLSSKVVVGHLVQLLSECEAGTLVH